jgi:hypothetical protein
MSSHEYTYVGAFLELTNVWENAIENVDACPKHGECGSKTKCEFCPECGSKIVKIPKETKRRKNLVGDKYEWEDKMVPAQTERESENSIILLPNHNKAGGIAGPFGSSGIIHFGPDAIDKCYEALKTKYADYISWLYKVRNFDVTPRFGVVHHWN